MADYGDVERVSTSFQAALGLLQKVRSELEEAGYDKQTLKWFVVSDGDKPWNFFVDWLGVTYRIAVSAKVETEQDRFWLRNATLSVSRLSDGTIQPPTFIAINEARIKIRNGSIHFGTESVPNVSEVVYPHHSAELLFFSMIGLPLDF